MSLDDLISDGGGGGRRGGRPASGVVRGGRPARGSSSGGVVRGGRPARGANARASAAPYARGGRPARAPRAQAADDGGHMSGSSVQEVAAAGNAVLKCSSESKPNSVAGAICNIVREAAGNQPPSVLATGPAAINQAVKAIAIARKYLLDETPKIDLLVTPRFEQDIRSGSNVVFDIQKARPIKREPTEDDLSAKEKTDAFKLAGAIAGRARDGEEVAVTTKGAIPVLVAVKAIALAQEYVQDDSMDIKFAVQFRDLADPEIRVSPESTFLHFAIVA